MIKESILHLKENKMTYIQHLLFASRHGARCIYAGLLLLIHSIIPGFFAKTGSRLVAELNKSFTDHRKNI